MNRPNDPDVTTDLPSPPASLSAGDPLPATVDDRGSASTDGTLPGVEPPARDVPEVHGYRVLREIARGGMGRVLAAVDLGLNRDVALKLLLPGASVDRFVRESKITARLPHPGIPPVHALGTLDDGSPFLAMKLVAGQTLAAELKAADRPRLLQAFTQVCQAVGFAHSRGVVHRDLKPSNVMVGAFGEVQVMDWGLAKDMTAQDAAEDPRSSEIQTGPGVGPDVNQPIGRHAPDESTDGRTRAGQVLGTPKYMAPEQARGEATDARADVFALGGILCAILTGEPPFRGTSTAEVVRRAAAADLTEANERLDGCGADADLVALCRRCLSPGPADRPADGQAVADGLTAYLNGVQDRLRAVERERAVAAATAVEDARRRKVLAVAAGLIVLALLGGITGTTIGLLRAREQRNLVEERNGQLTTANASTETERTRAEQNLGTARALIIDLGTRITQIETGQTNPRLADLARKQALDKAREQFDQFREGRPDDVTLQRQAALLHRFAAVVSRTLNDYPAATSAYSASVRISEDLMARFPDQREHRMDLALTLSDRSGLEVAHGKLKDAAATLERATEIAESPQARLRESAYHRTLGLIAADQSELAHTLGQFDDAARFARRSSELLDRLQTAPAPERQTLDPMFAAIAVHRVGLAERELGHTARAMAAHDDAVARMKALAGPRATRDERHWDCEVRRERARTAVAVPERRTAVLADLADVIPVAEKLVEENPHVYFYKAGVASTHLYRGELLLALDRPDQATAELTKSLAVSRVLIDRHGVRTRSMLVRGDTFQAIGRARAAAGRPDEALAHWKNAAKVFELALGFDADNFHHRRGLAEAQRLTSPPAK